MKLSNEEVLLLMVNIQPLVEHLESRSLLGGLQHREAHEKRLNEILDLQVKLNDYHDAAMQLAHEANQD